MPPDPYTSYSTVQWVSLKYYYIEKTTHIDLDDSLTYLIGLRVYAPQGKNCNNCVAGFYWSARNMVEITETPRSNAVTISNSL